MSFLPSQLDGLSGYILDDQSGIDLDPQVQEQPISIDAFVAGLWLVWGRWLYVSDSPKPRMKWVSSMSPSAKAYEYIDYYIRLNHELEKKSASLGRQYEDDKPASVDQPRQPESGLPRRGGLAGRLGGKLCRGIGRFFRGGQ